MAIEEPYWWYGPRWSWQSVLLAPVASIYGRIAGRRVEQPPTYRSHLPVLCVGNFTAGGTGKTPLSIALADMVRELGREPVFLSRGYGGSAHGPLIVDVHTSTAAETGDEPLLLARAAPTVVARDRVAGIQTIEKKFSGNTVVIMDDGLQNPALAKSFTIAVVDVMRRFGNGHCLPAGPLRAPLTAQLQRADAIVVNGEADAVAESKALAGVTEVFGGLILRARVAPAGDLKWLNNANVLAYAGIANPGRFFRLLEAQGARLIGRRTFSDHHTFTDAEASELLKDAAAIGARLVTTEKDFVRLHGTTGARGELRGMSMTLPVTAVFPAKDQAALIQRLAVVLNASPARQGTQA